MATRAPVALGVVALGIVALGMAGCHRSRTLVSDGEPGDDAAPAPMAGASAPNERAFEGPPLPPSWNRQHGCPLDADNERWVAGRSCCEQVFHAERNQDRDDMVLEYRLQHLHFETQPRTLGSAASLGTFSRLFDYQGLTILIRLEDVPRQGAGPVRVHVGPGHDVCDGTFTFYENAAPLTMPMHERHWDQARWDGFKSDGASWDWHAPEKVRWGAEMDTSGVHHWPVFPYGPFAEPHYEIPIANLRFLDLPLQADQLDCVGIRSRDHWRPEGTLAFFVPMEEADASWLVDSLPHMSLCQYIAFGPLSENESTRAACTSLPRTVAAPSSAARGDWLQLPDSLCPTTDEQFPCHLGTGEGAACNTAPDAPSDACCDPLGASDELPACNAWRITASYVLGAVAISRETTDQPIGGACVYTP